MTPRINFRAATRPLALAGSLWVGFAGQVGVAGHTPPAPPACYPDGYCKPNIPTWGVYSTKWRQFPGDEQQPTPAETTATDETSRDAQQRRLEEMRGPILPRPENETQTGPRPPATQAPTDGLPGGVPGVTPPPGLGQPGPEAGEAPADDPPAEEPADPFGRLPNPANPADYAVELVNPQSIPMAPAVEPATATPASHEAQVERDDDAPPALPAGLTRLSAVANPSTPVALAQPSSIQPPGFDPRRAALARPSAPVTTPGGRYDRQVAPASAIDAVGIQFVNPAGVMVQDAGEDGVQQAVYFEASDQPGAPLQALPSVGR